MDFICPASMSLIFYIYCVVAGQKIHKLKKLLAADKQAARIYIHHQI